MKHNHNYKKNYYTQSQRDKSLTDSGGATKNQTNEFCWSSIEGGDGTLCENKDATHKTILFYHIFFFAYQIIGSHLRRKGENVIDRRNYDVQLNQRTCYLPCDFFGVVC